MTRNRILSIFLVLTLMVGMLAMPSEAYAATKPRQTQITSISAIENGFKVKYKKVKKATGYQIQYSTSSNFKKAKAVKVKKSATVKKTIKGLKGNKKYFVRVRAYKTVKRNNKYSSWSKVKTIKTKATASATKPSTTYKYSTWVGTGQRDAYVELLTKTYNSMHITKNMSDLQKSLIIGKWITANVKYGDGGASGISPYDVLKTKQAICRGYSELFVDFCKCAGVEARTLTGSKNNGNHVWVAIKIDGYWYQIEPQSYGSFLNLHQEGTGCNGCVLFEDNMDNATETRKKNNFLANLGLHTGTSTDDPFPGTMGEDSEKVWNEKCKPHGTAKTVDEQWDTFKPIYNDMYHWQFN